MGSFLVERGHQPVSSPLIPVKSDSTWMARDRQRDIQSCVHCALLVPCLCGCMHVYNHRRLSKWIAWSPIWALGCWAKMTNKTRGPVNDSPGGGGTQRKTQTMVPIRTMKNNAMAQAGVYPSCGAQGYGRGIAVQGANPPPFLGVVVDQLCSAFHRLGDRG